MGDDGIRRQDLMLGVIVLQLGEVIEVVVHVAKILYVRTVVNIHIKLRQISNARNMKRIDQIARIAPAACASGIMISLTIDKSVSMLAGVIRSCPAEY